MSEVEVRFIPEGAHSILGPSGASRWMACPGSVSLAEITGAEEVAGPSFEAAEGTAAHQVFAECLNNNVDAFEFYGTVWQVGSEALGHKITVDDQMVAHLQNALDQVRNLINEHTVIYVEKSVQYHNDERAWGSGDVALFDTRSRKLIVLDLKYGKGLEVEAAGNVQLKLYTAGFRRLIEGATGKKKEVDTFCWGILQPRAPSGKTVKFDEYVPRGDFLAWEKGPLAKAIRAVDAKKPKFKAGEHCRWCPAMGQCPTFESYTKDVLSVDATVDEAKQGDDVLVSIFERAPIIRAYLKRVETELKGRLLRGQKVPGVKLIAGRSIRTWSDPDTIERLIQSEFGDEGFEHAVKSPAKIEKLAKGKDFAKKHAHKPQGAPVVAREADPGLEVNREASEVFAEVLKQQKENEGNE